jgi:hypothetical protein
MQVSIPARSGFLEPRLAAPRGPQPPLKWGGIKISGSLSSPLTLPTSKLAVGNVMSQMEGRLCIMSLPLCLHVFSMAQPAQRR